MSVFIRKIISKVDFHCEIRSKKGGIVIHVAFSMCAKFTYLHVNEADRGKAMGRREITLSSISCQAQASFNVQLC